MRELNADRPDKTDCPFTVDAGHYQVELDFANVTYDRANSGRGDISSRTVEIAPVNLKVGLLNNLDFQFVFAAYRWERTDDRRSGVVQRKAGFSGVTPRFKLNLIGNDGGLLAVAPLPFLNLPLNQGNLGGNSVQGGIGLPYAFDLGNWDLGLQTTYRFNHNGSGDGYHTEFENSVSLGHQLVGKLSLAVEFFSSVSTERGTGWSGTVDSWLTYQVGPNLRLDCGVYIGVTPAADDWHPWFGTTWRF